MDIKKLAIPQNSVKKELIMVDGTKTDIILHLISTDHPEYKKLDRKLTLKNFKKFADKKGGIDMSVSNLDEILDNSEATNIERAAICIVGWEGMTEGGKPFSFSHEKATKLLSTEGADWIVDFVNEFVEERANFIKG